MDNEPERHPVNPIITHHVKAYHLLGAIAVRPPEEG
jgi:hypothetical protein